MIILLLQAVAVADMQLLAVLVEMVLPIAAQVMAETLRLELLESMVAVVVAVQVVALLADATQSDTQLLRDTASARACCSAVANSLPRLATLLRTMALRRSGAASDAMIASKAMTTSTSTNVNPRERCFKSDL